MAIDTKLIDQFLAEHGRQPHDMAGENGLLKQLTKAVLERALQPEMTDHLGYEKHDSAGNNSGDSRNGKSRKKLTTLKPDCRSKASQSIPAIRIMPNAALTSPSVLMATDLRSVHLVWNRCPREAINFLLPLELPQTRHRDVENDRVFVQIG